MDPKENLLSAAFYQAFSLGEEGFNRLTFVVFSTELKIIQTPHSLLVCDVGADKLETFTTSWSESLAAGRVQVHLEKRQPAKSRLILIPG